MRTIKTTILLAGLSLFGSSLAAVPPSINEGVELYHDGRWIDARLSLLKAKDNISFDDISECEDVDFYLAMCAVELKDPHAETYISNFERNYPASHYNNRVRLAKALLYCSNERYREAKVLFEKIDYSTLKLSEKEDLDIRMGYILFLEQDYPKAREHYALVEAESELYHHALYYQSYIDYIEGDNSSARDGFSQLLDSEAYASVAPFYLLQIAFNEGQYAEVLNQGEQLYGKAVTERQIELDRTMSESAFRLEEYSKAVDYISRYQTTGGVMGREENYILGFSLYRQTRYDEALEPLRAACGADDELTQNASYHLADCYLRAGDKSSASQSFAMAVNESYNAQIAEDALFNYAKLQYELSDDRFNETINTLTRYINKYPESGERYEDAKELLVAAYYNSRNYDAAYKSIKELDNPDSDIRLALQRIALLRGLQNYNNGEYSTAAAQLEESQMINISPKYSSVARFYLSEIDFINGDYDSALNGYNTYIISAPQSDENYQLALFNIAYTKLKLDNNSEALGYFQRFIDATASDTFHRADALNRVGDIYYGKREFDAAKSSYQRATWSEHSPRYYALYQSAIIEGIQGEYSAKVKRLQSIVSVGEGDYVEDSMYELGRTYIAASDFANGVKVYERFIEEYPTSPRYAQVLSDLGLAYLNLNDKAKSLSYYDRAIKSSPQSSVAKDALQGVREIYINEGRANEYFDYASSVGQSSDLNSITRDSLSFVSAQKIYLSSEGRSQAAIESLSSYVKNYPQGSYTIDALFFLSDSYIKCNQKSDAISTLTLLSNKGANQYGEWVYDKLSSLCYAEGQYSQSAAAYLNLYNIASKSSVRSNAIGGYVNATLQSGDNKATIKMADYVAAQADVDPQLIVKVKHAKAKILLAQGDLDSAYVILNDLSSDPLSPEGAEARYILIESEFNSGNIDVAEQMIFEFAKSETEQAYQLARAFILLGDIYVLRNDSFQARATYQSIIDGYGVDGDNIVEQARAKIEKLE
ncbi:MAG: tetratricopeptide repeat protein [Rikenellaceae bacterium]